MCIRLGLYLLVACLLPSLSRAAPTELNLQQEQCVASFEGFVAQELASQLPPSTQMQDIYDELQANSSCLCSGSLSVSLFDPLFIDMSSCILLTQYHVRTYLPLVSCMTFQLDHLGEFTAQFFGAYDMSPLTLTPGIMNTSDYMSVKSSSFAFLLRQKRE